MKTPIYSVFVVVLGMVLSRPCAAESIDGRVIQIRLPKEDVALSYVETIGGFSVALRTATSEVQGQKLYIGDGITAAELIAHNSKGIFFQDREMVSGEGFKIGQVVKLRPGYKRAVDLKPGDIYVVMPGVTFKEPERK
jgi:hypothetical protein